MASYYELLKHPKWQKRRLEILQRAEFKCENCDGDEKTLHVHHTYYERGVKPWEYPGESLHVLCEACHQNEQDKLTLLHRQLGRIDLVDVQTIYGFALGLEAQQYPHAPLSVFSWEVADGLARAWGGITADEIIRSLQDGVIDGYGLRALFDEFAARNTRQSRQKKEDE